MEVVIMRGCRRLQFSMQLTTGTAPCPPTRLEATHNPPAPPAPRPTSLPPLTKVQVVLTGSSMRWCG